MILVFNEYQELFIYFFILNLGGRFRKKTKVYYSLIRSTNMTRMD